MVGMHRARHHLLVLGLVALGLLCWLSAALAAAEPLALRLDGGGAGFALDGHLSVLDDPGGRLQADEAAAAAFQPVDRPRLGTGTLWYRFTVVRGNGQPAEWLLAFGEPDIDDVRVFVGQPGGGFAEHRLGRHIPSRELPLAARRHVASLTLPEDAPATVLVRLSSRHKIRLEEAGLWRPGALMFEETRAAAFHGVHFGVLAVLVAVYGLFGMWLRDAAILFYALFVGTRMLGGLTHTGLAALMFPGAGGQANYLLSGIGLLGGVAAFILMWDRILDLKRNFPLVHRVYLTAGALVALPLLAVASPWFSVFARSAQAVMLAASLGSVTMAALLVRRNPGDVLMRFYLVAFLPVGLAWAVEIVALATGAIPPDWGRRIDTASTMTHIGILSVALTYRLARMQREWMSAEIALAGERLSRQGLRTFVDMATHEFKTPLAVIDSAAQMLAVLTRPASPEVDSRIANIRRAVKRLVRLIETCLAGERDLAVRPQPVSPAALLHEAAERNREPDRAPVVVMPTALPGTIAADADLLAIALDALIDNACRYGPADRPVTVSATAEDGCISFAVDDHGPGIRDQEADRIFEKYYRSPASAGIPGSGIGLHLVRTIATLHGGRVGHHPRPGGGSRFFLTIPAGPAGNGGG